MPTLFDTSPDQLAADSAKLPFDAIVVGGGSAGLTTALTLAEHGKTAVILEAGPAPFLTHISNTDLRFAPGLARDLRAAVQYSPSLSGGTTFGNNYGCLGGRSLFWNGAAPRYSSAEFDGWPIGSPDLEGDYAWAEDALRVTSFFGEGELATRIIDRLKRAGFAAEPGPFACDSAQPAPGRLSAGIGSGLGFFLRKAGSAVAQGSIRIATRSLAYRIILSNGFAKGVIVQRDGEDFEILARSVVLAGGGIESIKLAALSGVPDPNARLGRGLQEHLFYHGLFAAPHLFDPARAQAAVVYVPAAERSSHQWELHIPGDRLFAVDGIAPWTPDASTTYHIMIRSFAATEKRDENFVDAKDGPLGSSVVHMAHSARDEQTKAEIYDSARGIAAALELVPTDADGVDGAARFRALGSSYHEAGGLDMGLDRTTSVTDPNGRFHQVPNLICADAAAFPRIGASNPHLTIVAVARQKARALVRALT